MKAFLTVRFLGRVMHFRKSACLARGNLKPQVTGDIATKDLPETSQKFISNYHFLLLRIHSSESFPQIRFMETFF